MKIESNDLFLQKESEKKKRATKLSKKSKKYYKKGFYQQRNRPLESEEHTKKGPRW